MSSVDASPWNIQWNVAGAPTCLLCDSGSISFLRRDTSGIPII